MPDPLNPSELMPEYPIARRLAMMASLGFLAACLSAPAEAQSPAAPRDNSSVTADDPYLWLEEVESPRAMTWVKEHNTRTLGTLQGDPRYARYHAAALKILEAKDRIPSPAFRRGMIYNFWQDSAHVRGILRRTTIESYRTPNPEWTLVFDVDSLSAKEGANWVYRGVTCLEPEERLCMMYLSNGGKDANEIREFDMEKKAFVPNGFRLPESKGGVTWIDENTLLVNRNFGPGSLTGSGYPFVTRTLKRGQRIEDAPEFFRGDSTDVWASDFVMRDADGKIQLTMGNRGLTFYEGEYFLLGDNGQKVKLDLPKRVSFQALVDDQLVLTTESDWKEFKLGDLLAFDVSDLKANPAAAKAYLILRPGPRESIEGVSNTRNKLIVALYEKVESAV